MNVAPFQGERHGYAVPMLCMPWVSFYTLHHVYPAISKAAFHRWRRLEPLSRKTRRQRQPVDPTLIVLWNTIYMNTAILQLRCEGYPVQDEDVEKLSSLQCGYINMQRRYSFTVL